MTVDELRLEIEGRRRANDVGATGWPGDEVRRVANALLLTDDYIRDAAVRVLGWRSFEDEDLVSDLRVLAGLILCDQCQVWVLIEDRVNRRGICRGEAVRNAMDRGRRWYPR